ncbi:MAG: hypothetical protein MAG795_00639 [Candidatus Woesearchaeota archaeon]|nr:hypothetical protein [Candidatus Woesearchaeota archaeon]
MATSLINNFRRILTNVYANIILAFILLLGGIILAKVIGRVIEKLLKEIELNRFIKKTTSLKISVEELIANIVTYFLYFISVVAALDQLGIATTVLHFISIAAIIIVVSSILIGLRDFFPNVLAGIHLYQKRILEEGDKIKVGDVKGTVVKVSMTEIRIKTKKQDIIYIPNSLLIKQKVTKLKKL